MNQVRLRVPVANSCQAHLKQRLQERTLTSNDFIAFSNWIGKQPLVVEGPWYKKFNNFIIVGHSENAASVLTKDMKPHGTEIF